jgi:type I restriction enzyme M protein
MIKVDSVVANPPFSVKWSADKKFLEDPRFNGVNKLAPKSKGDYAFIQHMLYQLNETGHMSIILPHGVLFRGSSEGKIRQYLIEECNVLDAVIGLPSNLFSGTSIPTAILVFKKNREVDEGILFVDASKGFVKEKNINKLTKDNVDKIVKTYNEKLEVDKYSHIASLKEIKENDFNLNIPRYVDTFEEEEPIDLDEVVEELQKVEEEMKKVDKEIAKYCEELGIKAPIF